MKNFIYLFLILLIIGFFPACQSTMEKAPVAAANTAQSAKGQSMVSDELSAKNILQVAIGSSDHSTLVAAVQAAELEDVLVNAGPLTVFAPTNAAFAALPEGTLETLLKPENKATLARIIKFHAAPGGYAANNIRGVMGIGQATGDKVKVIVKDGKTTVDGGNILGTVKASNGYVHVIDKVLLPPEK